MSSTKRNVLLSLALLLFAVTSGYSIKYAKTTMGKLVQTSTVIAKVKVLEKRSSWDADHKKIFTFVDVQVMDVYKGNNIPEELTIKQLGGRVGEDAMIIHGGSAFEADHEAIVFLVLHKDNYWIHSMGLGKFDIVNKDNRQLVQNSDITNELLISEKLQSLNKVNPQFRIEEFKTEIQSFVK